MRRVLCSRIRFSMWQEQGVGGGGGDGHNLCVFVVCWDENKIRVPSSIIIIIIIASLYAMGYWCIVMRGGRWAFAAEFRCRVC